METYVFGFVGHELKKVGILVYVIFIVYLPHCVSNFVTKFIC